MQLTPHFKLSELACTNTQYKEKNISDAKKIMGRMYQLAGFAERIREIIGKPLIITSGYRCKELNKYLGGSLTSQHLLGEAIDIVVNNMRARDVFEKIVTSDLKYQQLILEQNKKGSQWVHIGIGSKLERLQYKDGKYTKM